MPSQGHSPQEVEDWKKQSEKINNLVESHQEVAAALGPGHKVTPEFRAMATQSDIRDMSKSDFNIRLLLDGGTFNHNFGRDTKQYRVNLRKVKPIPIKTAGGIVWLDLMCDLYMPGIYITGGYVNDHIDITLISESILAKHRQWTFYLEGEGKQVTVPVPDGYKRFWAQKIGNLFYIPLEIALLYKGRGTQHGGIATIKTQTKKKTITLQMGLTLKEKIEQIQQMQSLVQKKTARKQQEKLQMKLQDLTLKKATLVITQSNLPTWP